MSNLAVSFYARLGNNMFIYAHARALAEQTGVELRTPPWVGEAIFTLDNYPIKRPDGSEQVLAGYFQSQKDIIYTRADCRRWFAIKPELLPKLVKHSAYWPHAHFRRGDYAGAGYPLISRKAVDAAVAEHQFPGDLRKNMIPGREYHVVSDEHPLIDPEFTGELAMLPDFYRLMRAPVLYRANSTFSWWAATLSHGRVFAPIITGLAGGIEHDNVPYVEGNWPKCADGMDFVTDLHLKES